MLEYVSVDVLDRVAKLSEEAAAVVAWALRMEGALHRIEEFPEHEQYYAEDQRFETPQAIADKVLQTPLTEPWSVSK